MASQETCVGFSPPGLPTFCHYHPLLGREPWTGNITSGFLSFPFCSLQCQKGHKGKTAQSENGAWTCRGKELAKEQRTIRKKERKISWP
jgi:hypothetical protein